MGTLASPTANKRCTDRRNLGNNSAPCCTSHVNRPQRKHLRKVYEGISRRAKRHHGLPKRRDPPAPCRIFLLSKNNPPPHPAVVRHLLLQPVCLYRLSLCACVIQKIIISGKEDTSERILEILEVPNSFCWATGQRVVTALWRRRQALCKKRHPIFLQTLKNFFMDSCEAWGSGAGLSLSTNLFGVNILNYRLQVQTPRAWKHCSARNSSLISGQRGSFGCLQPLIRSLEILLLMHLYPKSKINLHLFLTEIKQQKM